MNIQNLMAQLQQFQKAQANPQDLLKQLTGKYSPEQMQQFAQFANGFGISNEQLSKYGINSKQS